MKTRGRIITLLGPDGSGKSTIADSLIRELDGLKVQTSHFHWRPRVLPPRNKDKLFKYDVTKPDEMPIRPLLLSMVLYIYFFMDFLVGYIWIIRPKLRKGEYVIYERYFYDVLVHPKRYRLFPLNWLGKLLCSLMPVPDLIVILHGKAELIHERKAELQVSEIERQQSILINLFSNRNRVKRIDVTSLMPDSIVSEILSSTKIS